MPQQNCLDDSCNESDIIRVQKSCGRITRRQGVGIKRFMAMSCKNAYNPITLIGQTESAIITQLEASFAVTTLPATTPPQYLIGYTGEVADVEWGEPTMDGQFQSDCGNKIESIASRIVTFNDYNHSDLDDTGTLYPYAEWDLHNHLNNGSYFWFYVDCNNKLWLIYDKSTSNPTTFEALNGSWFSYRNVVKRELENTRITEQEIKCKISFIGDPMNFVTRPILDLNNLPSTSPLRVLI